MEKLRDSSRRGGNGGHGERRKGRRGGNGRHREHRKREKRKLWRGIEGLKVLGIGFSSRENGNCARCLKYCLDNLTIIKNADSSSSCDRNYLNIKMTLEGESTSEVTTDNNENDALNSNDSELINIFDYKIDGCGRCEYGCFNTGNCSVEDDTLKIYNKCFEADKIIFAIPTFCGNLASSYFRFWERSQAIFKDNNEYEKKFLSKINLIIIGNLSSGGDMALHEAIYSFNNRCFFPETLLLSSREYDKSSVRGDLVEPKEVRDRLDNFIKRIIKAIQS